MKPFSSNRGVRGLIDPVTLTIIGVLTVVALFPKFHLPAFLQKKPPTVQLSQDQKDLAAAKAQLADAEAKVATAKALEAQKTHDQAAYAQQMLAGVPVALARAPQTPEVILASQLAQRAQTGLAAAIGDLPADKQAEITQIVGQALSAKQAEVDAAKTALAAKDAQLQATTLAKQALDVQIPVLQAAAKTKDAQVEAKQAAVDEKTAEVADWAQKKADSDAEAGSWRAYAVDAVRIIAAILILWALVHFIFPSLAQEFTASKWLQAIYRWTTSIFSSHITTTTPVSK